LTIEQQRIAFLLETEAELLRIQALSEDEDTVDSARDLPPYITNYIGSKQKLADWIWAQTPDGVESILDAFSGSAVVAYMYKTKGLRVLANDRLRYCYHIARAIIENNAVRLTEDEIAALLEPNPKAGDFVQTTFRGKFFQSGVHPLIDTIRANIEGLKGYKKDIALFALGKSCISASGSYGHFASVSRSSGNRQADTPAEFIERFKKTAARISELVFDNGQENKAFHEDAVELLPKVNVDAVYIDPPYATEFSTTNYETSYHFIEGLMTYWKGLEIDESSRVKKFISDHQTVTKANAAEFFDKVFQKAEGIKYWIISYRDHAYPDEAEMKRLIGEHNRSSRMHSRDHVYTMAGQNRGGEASHGREHLFICSPETAADAVLRYAPFATIADLRRKVEKDEDARVTAFMGSKHDMLAWIWEHTPEGVKSVLDLFSGGANVGYYYKLKGMRVVSNDLLAYPYHIARAVIENSSVTLSDAEIEGLLQQNSKAKDFIVKTFFGYYYTRPILEFLDNTYANIQNLSGYKKDIALFALGRVCLIRACYGEFSRSKKSLTAPITNERGRYPDTHLGNPSLAEFRDLFLDCIRDANSLIFDNGQECKATNQEALALFDSPVLSKSGIDLVYADPPYITQFGFNDYEDKLHFVEGLMTYWEGKEINDNPRRNFPSRTKYNPDGMQKLIGGFIEGTARLGARLMMSYRDKAYPTAAELKEMIAERFGSVEFRRRAVSYGIARYAPEGPGRNAQEYLLIASKPKAMKAAAADKSLLAPLDTPWEWDWAKEADAIIELLGWKGLFGSCAYTNFDYPAREKEDNRYPMAKAAYYLPYRKMVDGKLLVVWQGLVAAMAALNGARGGTKLSAAARKEAYWTLVEWYQAFDKEPPELASDADQTERGCHTRITGEIKSQGLAASGDDLPTEDKRFTCVLVHGGANRNGDFFTVEELRSNYRSAVGTKVDLKHSQDLTDIVGGVVDSRFFETDDGYIECDGELYTSVNPNAQLAYKLMTKGIVRQVSMECDYETGECSICHKQFKSKADYCVHLKNYKGRDYRGDPVYEILHNITFTGMGLLDRKGADERAVITKVASQVNNLKEEAMSEEDIKKLTNENERLKAEVLDLKEQLKSKTKAEESAAAEKQRAEAAAKSKKDEEIERLTNENEALKKQVEELQGKAKAYEAEKQQAARRTRASELVSLWEKRGRSFAGDEDRVKEIERLAALDDASFTAAKSMVDSMSDVAAKKEPAGKKDEPKDPDNPDKKEPKKVLRSDAGVDPSLVDDKPSGLVERLSKGLREVRDAA